MHASPEKWLMRLVGIGIIFSWALGIIAFVLHSSGLKRVALVSFGVTVFLASSPLIGFVIFLAYKHITKNQRKNKGGAEKGDRSDRSI